jgi:hypothetical protein
MYYSIAKSSYVRPHTGSERAGLSAETKADLRREHFKMGYHDHPGSSEYKKHFN